MTNEKCKNFELETLNFEPSFVTICPTVMADEYGLVEKSRIMDPARMKRALSRLASEIVEDNQGAKDLYIVGIRRRGVPIAERLVEKIEILEGERPDYGIIDITLYRDDLSTVGANPIVNRTELDVDIENKNIILVDDVLYTGRTIRAALDQLMDFGRPRKVQLAVLIDRGKGTPRASDSSGFYRQNRADQTQRNHQSNAQRV
jgi:pyrimidine operon attenuation protein/uracil phosphoribosyltransferase